MEMKGKEASKEVKNRGLLISSLLRCSKNKVGKLFVGVTNVSNTCIDNSFVIAL